MVMITDKASGKVCLLLCCWLTHKHPGKAFVNQEEIIFLDSLIINLIYLLFEKSEKLLFL